RQHSSSHIFHYPTSTVITHITHLRLHLFKLHHPPTSTLFPYTTLFRSCLSAMERLHREFGDGKYRPAPILRNYVAAGWLGRKTRSEEHTSELQSRGHLVCRLLLEKKN